MRLNPFSQSVGRRRAAMLQGDASDENGAEVETENMTEAASPTDEEAIRSEEDRKRFGFAYRSELERDDVEGKPADGPPPHQPPNHADHQRNDAQADGTRAASDAAPAKPPLQGRSGPRPSAHEEPVVSTPHIERLRQQIGADAAEAIEPWLPDDGAWAEETKARSTTSGAGPELAANPSRQHARNPNETIGDTDQAAYAPEPTAGAAHPSPPDHDIVDHEASEPQQMTADVEPVAVDPIEDVAVTIGRIVSIRGSVIWGALFDDIDGQAARAARMGALVSMRGPQSRVFGIVNRLEREQQGGNAQSERTVFEIQVLGEIADDRAGFQRGVSSYPPLDAPVTTITIRDIATIYARPRCSNVHIGQLRHNPRVPAFVLTDSLLGKHFAVLGTTGTGKSCATTVILRSILDEHPNGHIVLIDPHNEYGAAFADRAELLNPSNLHLPYWLLNFEEIAHILLGGGSRDQMDSQATLLKNAIIQAKTKFVGDNGESLVTVDTPVPYRLSDLMSALKDAMGMFNKAEGSSLYLGLINRIEGLAADQRYGFMFSRLSVRDNMEQILAQLLRIPTNGKPMTIIDISGLPSEVVDVVVSVLFRLTFELAVWSERGKAPPVLLVCEEAHRYVPEESDVGFAPTKRVIAQIAKEGRKYGVTLCLVSQTTLRTLGQFTRPMQHNLRATHEQRA